MEEGELPPDPLGARDTVVHVENLTRWNLTQLPLVPDDSEINGSIEYQSPFPWNNELNNKVLLW